MALSWLSWSASVIRSLAWPAAVAFSIWLLRENIGWLIDRIKSADYKGVHVDLSREIEKAEEAVAEAKVEEPEVAEEELITKEQLEVDVDYLLRHIERARARFDDYTVQSLATQNPRWEVASENAAAFQILRRWNVVEEKVMELYRVSGLEPSTASQRLRFGVALKRLRDHGVLTEPLFHSINELKKARDKVAHSSDPRVDLSQAGELLDLAEFVTKVLDMRINELQVALPPSHDPDGS